MFDKDYVITDPVGASQARTYILLDILEKSSPKYRKEVAKWMKK
jgi:hypothetical protein